MNSSFRQNLSILLLLAASLHAKVVQPGLVRLQNSGNKPLAGVQVSFIGSNRTTSDGKGAFSLEFPDKKPGDGIVNPKVSKSGYEWVNEPDFHSVVASGEASIELVMCPAGQLSAQREKYYGLSEAATLTALERRLSALESLRKQDEVAWQQQKDSLTKQSEQQLKQAGEMADQFARFNFDDASALHRQAFELFQTGRIDSAVRLLEGANLPKQLRGRYQERSLLSSQARGNDQEIRSLMPAMIFQAELYSLRMEYEKAAPLYDTLVLLDTNDVANLATVAWFYQSTWKNYGKWENLNRRLINLPESPSWRRGKAYCHLGDLFLEIGKLDSAYLWFLRYNNLTDSMYRADSSISENVRVRSVSLERLGYLMQVRGKSDSALEYMHESFSLSEMLYKGDSVNTLFMELLAISCNKLGDLFLERGDLSGALKNYLRSNQLFYKIPQRSSEQEMKWSISLQRLGVVYREKGDYNNAVAYSRKDVDIHEKLFCKNQKSEEIELGLAISHSLLGEAFFRSGEKDSALFRFIEFNRIMHALFAKNRKSMEIAKNYAVSMEKLGRCYQAAGNNGAAIMQYGNEIELFSELSSKSPDNLKLKEGLAIAWQNLGDIYKNLADNDRELVAFGNYNRIMEELFQACPTRESIKRGLAISLERLVDYYLRKGDFENAFKNSARKVKLYEELFRNDSLSIDLKNGLALSYGDLGDACKIKGDYSCALKSLTQRKQLLEELNRDNPKNESLKNGLAISYSKLGGVQKAVGDFPKALEAYRKAISLSEELLRRNSGIPAYATNLTWNLKEAGPLACQLEQKGDGIAFQLRAADLYDSLYRSSGTLWQLVSAGEVYANLSNCPDSTSSKIAYLQKALERQLIVFQKDTSAYENVSNRYWDLTGIELMAGSFAESENAARSGRSLAVRYGTEGQRQLFDRLRGHAILFQGRFAEAETIYRELKDLPCPQDTTKTFAFFFLQDFTTLEQAGITHPDVAKVRALLGTKAATKPEAAVEPKKAGQP